MCLPSKKISMLAVGVVGFLMAGILPCLSAPVTYTASWDNDNALYYESGDEYGFDASATTHDAEKGWTKSSILEWEVSNEKTGGPEGYDWHYEYSINVAGYAAVRWVIETGSGFTMDNIADIEISGDDSNNEWNENEHLELGYWSEESGDLDKMPGERYGLFFKETSGGGGNTDGEITVSFWSDMKPMWGDLFANCGGGGNRGWNEGFERDNPTGAPDDGSNDNHVLVPTPEPSAFILLLLGSGLLAMKRRLV